LYAAIFSITTMMVLYTQINRTVLFWITLFGTCLCGFCGAVLSGGLFGLAACLPPQYTAALMSGQGLAGFVVSLCSILTTLASKPSSNAYCLEYASSSSDQSGRALTSTLKTLPIFQTSTLSVTSRLLFDVETAHNNQRQLMGESCDTVQVSYSALVYFSVATAILITSYLAVYWLFDSPFIRSVT
jgi:hypothetical protein